MNAITRRFVLVCGLTALVGLSAPTAAHAQACPALHAPDYAPVIDKRCGNWILQRMDRVDPSFGPHGWQLDDQGKQYVLVANYGKSTSGGLNRQYSLDLDRALLVDDADLRVGKARPIHDDRVDAELEASAVGLYLESSYASALRMLSR